MSDISPAAILCDELGNPVGIILDGSVYRLQTETKLAAGHGLAVEGGNLATLAGKDFATQTTLALAKTGLDNIYTRQGDGNQKTQIYDASGHALQAYNVNSGGAEWDLGVNLRVSGATGSIEAKGQQTAANSIPVVMASDQTPLIVTFNPGPSVQAGIIWGDVSLTSVITTAVRRTAYTEPSANFTGSIVSSSAADTAAGTGARTVKISYMSLDGTVYSTEAATLNGTTAVNLTASNKCYIDKIEVETAGSGGQNAGTVSLYTGSNGTGTLVGTIAVGNNITYWCHHYVPAGKVCNIAGITVGSTATTVGTGSSYVLKAKTLSVANSVEKQVADTIQLYGQANQITRNYTTAIPIATGPARLVMYVTTQGTSSITYRASFDYFDSVP